MSRRTSMTAIGFAILAMIEGEAVAQTAAPDVPTLKTVEVKGFRSQNTRSIATKDASAVTVDSVASDEIGRLPDFNVGEALKRVTGVSTLEYQGEARYVVVRGLKGDYNATLIDGFAMASADIGSRQVLMEMLPSNFVRRIDVTKTFLPETDGGAVGGVTNLVSASGFTHPDGVLAFQAKGGANLMGDQYGGRTPVGEAAATWGKRFGASDEFAILGSASYWRRRIHVPQLETGSNLNWYNADGTRSSAPYGGNGIAVPSERRWYNYDNDRDRSGVTARLDWRPEGPVSGRLSSYYFKQQEDSKRATQNAQVQPNTVVSNQTATSGTLNNVQQYVELGRLRWDRALYGINGDLNAELAPSWQGDVRGSVSRATSHNPQTWDQFRQSGLTYNYDWRGAAPTFTSANPALSEDASRYANAYHREESTDYAERVTDLQTNLRHNMAEDGRGFGAAVGARLVLTRMDTSFQRRTWNGLPYNLSDVQGGTTCGFNCNTPLYGIDPGRADDLWSRSRGGVTPADDLANQYANTYGVKEDVKAAYAQTQWRGDDWRITGGLRFEHTTFSTNGWQQNVVGGNGTPTVSYSPAEAERRYHNFLPSVAGSYATGDESKLRFSVSRSIGRPRLDQMALKGGTDNNQTNTRTTSNPDLKPRRSTNFDLGHDWVLDGGRSMVAVGLFHKEIKDEIFRYGESQAIDGEAWTVIQPRNAQGTVRITGLEFGAVKELGQLVPALNGFAVSFNALAITKVRNPVKFGDGTETTIGVLPQQPKHVWNLALMYEASGWHAKLAWNHTGQLWDDRFPNYDNQAQFYRNRYQKKFDKVDVQLAYDVTPAVSLTLDVQNLTGQDYQYRFGSNQEYLQSTWKTAPSVLVGVSAKL